MANPTLALPCPLVSYRTYRDTLAAVLPNTSPPPQSLLNRKLDSVLSSFTCLRVEKEECCLYVILIVLALHCNGLGFQTIVLNSKLQSNLNTLLIFYVNVITVSRHIHLLSTQAAANLHNTVCLFLPSLICLLPGVDTPACGFFINLPLSP